jgi:hypothetical protein
VQVEVLVARAGRPGRRGHPARDVDGVAEDAAADSARSYASQPTSLTVSVPLLSWALSPPQAPCPC